MPASIIASASSAKYAGPEPETAVTASMSAPGRGRRRRGARAPPRRGRGAPRPRARLRRCRRSPRARSTACSASPGRPGRRRRGGARSRAVGIAAATERTVCSGWISVPISPSRASMSCGLTAITTSAAPRRPPRRSTAWPRCRVARAAPRRAPARRVEAAISSAGASRTRAGRRSAPRRSCPPRGSRSSARHHAKSRRLGARLPVRRATSALAPGRGRVPAGQEVDTREAGPLAVRLEQLRRLRRLDPAPASAEQSLTSPRSPTRPWS